MNRAQRRQAARMAGNRGTKAKRKGHPRGELPTIVTPDGKLLTQSEANRTFETAKRLRGLGFEIVDSMIWTPEDA